MWLQKIFAHEFGYSDIEGNYSRVYPWMANQLGHLTLGMAVVLFFYWFHDTVGSAGALVAQLGGVAPPANSVCTGGFFCAVNDVFLLLNHAGRFGE
jgi:hypothetical protein